MSQNLAECGIKLVIPIGTDSPDLSGALMLGNKLSGKKFTVSDIELLKTLTTNVAFIMRRMELQEKLISKELEKQMRDEERKKVIREMGIAKEVQQKLFPHAAPHIETVDYYGICCPADDVGGDYYDYFMLGSGKLTIAIGDVSGHGLSSALMMAGVTASIRGKAPLFEDNLKELISDINNYLCHTTTEEKFLTLFYAIYDIEKKSMKYVNAGHLPPLLYKPASDEFLDLFEGGLMLGMIEDIGFEEKEICLQKDDVIVMFTDGIPETMDREKELWGTDKLKDVIRMNYNSGSEELSKIILNEANKFADGLPLDDDATIITFKIN
ncbi:MAG: SpoIIE family protein phosphatase [Ignavibacteriae bacterium]|nr:SpoIIE family protein phosphatase [Ignavibacteriota bacterium]